MLLGLIFLQVLLIMVLQCMRLPNNKAHIKLKSGCSPCPASLKQRCKARHEAPHLTMNAVLNESRGFAHALAPLQLTGRSGCRSRPACGAPRSRIASRQRSPVRRPLTAQPRLTRRTEAGRQRRLQAIDTARGCDRPGPGEEAEGGEGRRGKGGRSPPLIQKPPGGRGESVARGGSHAPEEGSGQAAQHRLGRGARPRSPFSGEEGSAHRALPQRLRPAG